MAEMCTYNCRTSDRESGVSEMRSWPNICVVVKLLVGWLYGC